MCEIFKALQQVMKLTHQAKSPEQLKARIALIGLLSSELAASCKQRIKEIDDTFSDEEKLH